MKLNICPGLVLAALCISMGKSSAQNSYDSTSRHDRAICKSSLVDLRNGDIYSTGYFNGDNDFYSVMSVDPVSKEGEPCMYITKSDSNGHISWSRSFGGIESGVGGYAITFDTNAGGSIYITGYFVGTIDFDPGDGIYYLSAPVYNPFPEYSTSFTPVKTSGDFICKLDTDGNFIWAKAMVASDEDSWVGGISVSIEPGTDGSICNEGNFHGTVDFDPGPDTYFLTGAGKFKIRLDALGNFRNVEIIQDVIIEIPNALPFSVDAVSRP